jgi:hypothetical protein
LNINVAISFSHFGKKKKSFFHYCEECKANGEWNGKKEELVGSKSPLGSDYELSPSFLCWRIQPSIIFRKIGRWWRCEKHHLPFEEKVLKKFREFNILSK